MQIFINTYGSYLHVKDEMFEIKQKDDPKEELKVKRIAAQKISSFIISKGTAISTDAVALAVKHNIDIVIVENDGHPIGRFWHSKLGSTTKIRKCQLEASLNEDGLDWVKTWITNKLQNQADHIQDLRKHRKPLADYLETKKDSILSYKEKINCVEGKNTDAVAETIRGWEGNSGRHYFEALSRAIPEKFKFRGRSFRPAVDPFNAMLNYAYGILYSRVERVLMLAGLDPYVGFLHGDDYNKKSLVFDYIEPYRIYAEKCIFTLFTTKKVKLSFFDEITGGISLNPEGKPFLVEHFIKYLEQENIRYKGRNQTRSNAMQMDAHQFANALIK